MQKWGNYLVKLRTNSDFYLETMKTLRIAKTIQKIQLEILWIVYVQAVGLLMSRFQWNDTLAFVSGKPSNKFCWNYARGIGKTEKASHLAVFGVIVDIDVDWTASVWAQLKQAQVYWSTNPFVAPFRPSNRRQDIQLINGSVFDIYAATEDNIRGKRGEWVFADEVARIDSELIEVLESIADHVYTPKFLFISTPVLGSSFEDVVNRYPTYTRSIYDCPWMNHKEIEKRRIPGLEWLWDQEHLAKFVLPAGAVFPNIQLYTDRPPNAQNQRSGVDLNGASNGNIHVTVGELDGRRWILEEKVFQYKLDDDLLKRECLKRPTCVEAGGWNEVYGIKVAGVQTKIPDEEWKAAAVKSLLMMPLMVNKFLTPGLYKDLTNCVWGENGKIDTHPLHYLSALMLAVMASSGIVDVKRVTQNAGANLNIFKNDY